MTRDKLADAINEEGRDNEAPASASSGASYQTRTDDPRFTRAMLYQLS